MSDTNPYVSPSSLLTLPMSSCRPLFGGGEEAGGVGAAFALFVVLALAGFKMLGWLSAPGTTVRNLVIYTTVVPVAYILLFSRLYGQTIRQSVRRQLVRNGIPVCIFCGYDLRGSKDRCPECGTTVSLRCRLYGATAEHL